MPEPEWGFFLVGAENSLVCSIALGRWSREIYFYNLLKHQLIYFCY